MTSPEKNDAGDELSLYELFRPLWTFRRGILLTAVVVTLVAAVLGGVYYLGQPERSTSGLQFRPVFESAEHGEYPNGLPFASSDIVNPAIVSEVFERNKLQDYCAREAFQAGLTVAESSPALEFLRLEYQARLADIRLSAVERQRLQDEFNAKRQALSRQYRLSFIRPEACRTMPNQVVAKALTDVLETWANDSEQKRGVLNIRVPVLTPSIFDPPATGIPSLMVRADLVRSAILRVLDNIELVRKLPGSRAIRMPETGASFAEVQARLDDLVQAWLDPLVATAGRGLGPESVAWVQQALSVAQARHATAQRNVEAYRAALREYSGMSDVVSGKSSAAGSSQGANDVPGMTTTIDQSFIDRIMNLSATNTNFRQELTRDLVDASLLEVQQRTAVEHYSQVLASLQRGASSLSSEEVTKRLDAIVAEAKRLTAEFGSIYEEFSRVSLRPGPALYRVEQPVVTSTIRAFSRRDLLLLVAGAFFLALVVAGLGCMIRARWHAFEALGRR